jgi:hypothetical protein
MDKNDKITIERWDLEDIIDSFRVLVNTYPKIKERKSCLDRKLMESYARLVYLYNGEKYGGEEFIKFYVGNGKVPKLKTADDFVK